MKTSHETKTQRTFDSFCKKVLKNEARDHHGEVNRLIDREKPFSELSRLELDMLSSIDEYPSECDFCVLGLKISIESSLIAEAIGSLPKEKRDIILLYYFFDLNDKQIGAKLNLAVSSVQYKRTSSLRELKKFMGERLIWESQNL